PDARPGVEPCAERRERAIVGRAGKPGEAERCSQESATRSGIVRSTADHGTARTRHPDTVALDAAVKVAAVLVFLEESLERVEQRHSALVEHALLDDLVRPDDDGLRDGQAQGLYGLEVQDQFKFGWLLHRQIVWPHALEHLPGNHTGLTRDLPNTGAV